MMKRGKEASNFDSFMSVWWCFLVAQSIPALKIVFETGDWHRFKVVGWNLEFGIRRGKERRKMSWGDRTVKNMKTTQVGFKRIMHPSYLANNVETIFLFYAIFHLFRMSLAWLSCFFFFLFPGLWPLFIPKKHMAGVNFVRQHRINLA